MNLLADCACEKRLELEIPRVYGAPGIHRGLDEDLERYRFDEALKTLWLDIDRINAEIARDKPWEKIASDREGCAQKVLQWLKDLRQINYWLGAFLPEASARIERQLGDLGNQHGHLFERLKLNS